MRLTDKDKIKELLTFEKNKVLMTDSNYKELKLGQLEDIEDKLGIDLITLFDYKECPFCILELEKNKGNTIFFDGESFDGYYDKEEFLQLIKRLIKVYLETWGH